MKVINMFNFLKPKPKLSIQQLQEATQNASLKWVLADEYFLEGGKGLYYYAQDTYYGFYKGPQQCKLTFKHNEVPLDQTELEALYELISCS